MENTRKIPKSASIALLMAVLSVIIFVSALLFELDADWLEKFLMGTCSLSLAGCIVGAYSLLLKRSARGIAAVLISALMVVIFVALVLLFQDMCVIC